MLAYKTWLFLLLILIASCQQQPDSGHDTDKSTPFREQSDTAGLLFHHLAGSESDGFVLPRIMGSGVALFDYDRDGDLDVYLIQAGSLGHSSPRAGNKLLNNLLIPEGRLAFEDRSAAAGLGDTGYGMGVAVGDADNDGDPDLFLTNFGTDVFFRNNGDGSFAPVAGPWERSEHLWSASAAFTDIDLDGDLDLFVTRYVDFQVSNTKSCFGPSGQRDYCGPDSYRPTTDRLFRNEGSFVFTDISQESGIDTAKGAGLGVVAAKFDDDVWPDLLVANDGGANHLWINDGTGGFVERGLERGIALNADGLAEAGMGIATADFDTDGDLDVFLSHLTGESNTLYSNGGDGNFFDTTKKFSLAANSLPATGFGTVWLDYDHDGLLDLFVANGAVTARPEVDAHGGYGQRNQLFRNLDGQKFEQVEQYGNERAEISRGVAAGDIDNDGDIDLVVTNNNGAARLLINDAVTAAKWTRIRLIGDKSPRDGTGSQIDLLCANGSEKKARVHSDGSYLSASDPRVLLIWPEPCTSPRISVLWSSNRQEYWDINESNRELTLLEGTGSSQTLR